MMIKKQLCPQQFTPTVGAYSHGISVDMGFTTMIFVTGQVAMDKDGKVVGLNDIQKQTEFIFENIKLILSQANASIEDLVKITIYVTDMKQFQKVSEIRNKYLATSKPVSTLVQIQSTVIKGCDIEIDAIAVKKKKHSDSEEI